MIDISSVHLKAIDATVEAYKESMQEFEADASVLQTRLLANKKLRKLVHSMKLRAKDPDHLKDKLLRKAEKAAITGEAFEISPELLFDRIHDLAGVRLLHLHIRQMEMIHPLLIQIFNDEGFVLNGTPDAKTWDYEYEQLFQKLGLSVTRDDSLYTSVHYVVKQNSRNRRHCELQVRTLAEELWGEVSHAINYPHKTSSLACREQLKALARFVSGCSRLVDSIVASHEDHRATLVSITVRNVEMFRGELKIAPGDLDCELWDVFDRGLFNITPSTMIVSLEQIVSTKNQLLDPKFIAGNKADPRQTALSRMRDAAGGVISRRAPITVFDGGDGTFYVVDGHATVQVLMLLQWDEVPVFVIPKP